ncbi:MAG TPA: phosphoribosylamine--glycine ligase [Acidimicrobiia bacterium]|nr:phosphoribosylamine--glycine ligase [Acidimicrobiia bacterium]
MRVLLLGSGGREHAIAWKLAQSPLITNLVSCPGNPGSGALGDVAPDVDPMDPQAVVTLAQERRIDLVVVGPEGPLAAGVVDALHEARIAVFGPTRQAAMLESSKAFAKQVMTEAGVPAGAYAEFRDRDSAIAHLRGSDGPYVVKADGLAAGKGVLVTDDRPEAEAWVDACLAEGRFGAAGSTVVIEEYLDGAEVSVFFICSGGSAVPLEPARDYKRLNDDDHGPNTGGMGAYSPVHDLDDGLVEWTRTRVAEPTIAALAARGIDYTGFLYVGLMLTAEGPKVLEFNCRLGDPETQVLLPRLRTDLLEVLHAGAHGALGTADLEWSDTFAAGVVLASPGYPDAPETGLAIIGLDHVAEALVFHAGTSVVDGRLVTSGGRVLTVVGLGDTLAEAREDAYSAANLIQFRGKHIRSDIAVG